MTPHTTRRALLAGLSATTLLAVLPLPALALTTAGGADADRRIGGRNQRG